jgi:hypothetical protein
MGPLRLYLIAVVTLGTQLAAAQTFPGCAAIPPPCTTAAAGQPACDCLQQYIASCDIASSAECGTAYDVWNCACEV